MFPFNVGKLLPTNLKLYDSTKTYNVGNSLQGLSPSSTEPGKCDFTLCHHGQDIPRATFLKSLDTPFFLEI
jgi:hypothetical protein